MGKFRYVSYMGMEVVISCCAGRVWEKAMEYQSKLTEEKQKRQKEEKSKEEKNLQEIMNINGMDCYEKDGTVWLKLETVARGLGFTEIAKSGNEVVKWSRVRKYLSDLGFSTSVENGIYTCVDGIHTSVHGDFIPENIFYRLAMKAKNETAEKFQALVADKIIPSIRRHGAYLTPQKLEEVLLDPDTMIRLCTEESGKRKTYRTGKPDGAGWYENRGNSFHNGKRRKKGKKKKKILADGR